MVSSMVLGCYCKYMCRLFKTRVRLLVFLQVPRLFKIKLNTVDYLEEYTWNIVSNYWFGLVPNFLVKSVVLFLDLLLVFGRHALDIDNRRRLCLPIQHCSKAAPGIFL